MPLPAVAARRTSVRTHKVPACYKVTSGEHGFTSTHRTLPVNLTPNSTNSGLPVIRRLN